MPLPSKIPFASLLHYCTRGTSDASRRSRDFTIRVKNGGFYNGRPAVDFAVELLASEVGRHPGLRACFGPDVWLVPAPKSAPLVKGALWPTERLCNAIAAAGLAHGVRSVVRRVNAVQKSATAAKEGRPRPTPMDHYDSIAVDSDPSLTSGRITVVDDVVSRGATFVGCYARLHEAYPSTPIHSFGLARTIGTGEVDRVLGPGHGDITCFMNSPARVDS